MSQQLALPFLAPKKHDEIVRSMRQVLSFAAFKQFYQVFADHRLIIPHVETQNISRVNFKKLSDLGVKGVVLDKDNTITSPHQLQVHPLAKKGLDECVQVFGSKVAIFSNTAGSVDDIGHRKAIEIEKYFGISVIRHKEKKPGGVNDVLNFFKCDKEQIAVIGDRYLTDILFGNMHGMLTIHTSPLTKDGESVTVAIIRKFENRLVQRWSRTTQPPFHPLFSSHVEIITKEYE